MKYFLGFVLLIASFSVQAINIQPNLSGSWFNPNQDGHGLAVEVLENDLTLIYWYVYQLDGSPMFLITVGNNAGNTTTGVTYFYSGMKFGDFNPVDNTREVWGTTSVRFDKCDTASLTYTANDPAYGTGQIAMQRLTSIAGSACTETPVHGNYLATLNDTTGFGSGLAIAFENQDFAYLIDTDTFSGVALGQWQLSQTSNFEFNVSAYSLSGGSELVYGFGTYIDGIIKAQYTGDGQFVAAPVSSFQHKLFLADMAGTFDIVVIGETEVVGTATVTNRGSVEATTNDGCVFAGSVSVPNNKFNQGYVIGDISGCPESGALSGAFAFNHSTKTFRVLASNGFTGFAWKLIKK